MWGVVISYASVSGFINRCTIMNNLGTVISGAHTTTVTITNSTISNNSGDTIISIGSYEAESIVTIDNNEIIRNSSATAIRLSCKNANIRKNKIMNNSASIYLDHCTSAAISHNIITQNNGAIRVIGLIYNVNIDHNLIKGNTGGIEAQCQGTVSITYNTITNNSGSGVSGSGASIKTISNCNIHDNTDYDVYSYSSSMVTIGGNRDLQATNNWWGTTDPLKISEHIYDHFDNPGLDKVVFHPYLTTPVPDAGPSEEKPQPALAFTKDVYNFTVKREYNQQVSVGISNIGSQPQDLRLTVENSYSDIAIGFVGEGSENEVIPVNPGETKDVLLAIHTQDAQIRDYQFLAKLQSISGKEILFDTAILKVHVDAPLINYEVTELRTEPGTLVKTYKITNRGDTITDLKVTADENLKDILIFQPSIQHARLSSGSSIEFQAIPILSAFAKDPSLPRSGNIIVACSDSEKKVKASFDCPPEKLHSVTKSMMIIAKAADWYCTNKPHIEFSFNIPAGFDYSDIEKATLLTTFTPKSGWHHRPHDVNLSLNGHSIGKIKHSIPSGPYFFDIDRTFFIIPKAGVATNIIQLDTPNINGGEYVVASDFELHIVLKRITLYACADSQKEAEAIIEKQMTRYFVSLPKSWEIKIDSPADRQKLDPGVPFLIQASSPDSVSGLCVVANFSNGDSSMRLNDQGNGKYSGEWTPQNPGDERTGKVTITVTAGACRNGKTQCVVLLNPPDSLMVNILSPKEGFTYQPSNQIIIKAHVTNQFGTKAVGCSVSATFSNGDEPVTLYDDGEHNDVLKDDGIYANRWTPENMGRCVVTIVAKRDTVSASARVGGYVGEPPKFLDVPYYNQDHTEWCYLTSLAMILKYYGCDVKPWEIAADDVWDSAPNQVLEFLSYPRVQDKFEEYLKKFNLKRDWKYHYLVGDLENYIKQNRNVPVWLWLIGNHHTVVVVGSDDDAIYITDPSKLFTDGVLIGSRMTWEEFKRKIKFYEPIAATMNITNPPEPTTQRGTIYIRPGYGLGQGESRIVFRHNVEGITHALRLFWDGREPHNGYLYGNYLNEEWKPANWIPPDKSFSPDTDNSYDNVGYNATQADTMDVVVEVANCGDSRLTGKVFVVIKRMADNSTVFEGSTSLFKLEPRACNVFIPIFGNKNGNDRQTEGNLNDDKDNDNDGLVDEDLSPIQEYPLSSLVPGTYKLELTLKEKENSDYRVMDSCSFYFNVAAPTP